ncbi:MAG: hypothetical protein JWQ79_3976 [Mucilaginibacter sp.]|jgi:hypothetical protein|nr:hypothetical protein [Mucilaginibacter sp.]
MRLISPADGSYYPPVSSVFVKIIGNQYGVYNAGYPKTNGKNNI